MTRFHDTRWDFLHNCDSCIGCEGKIAYNVDNGCPQWMGYKSIAKPKRKRKACTMEEFEANEYKQAY